MNVIEVENLTKDYGHGRGVFNISFQIKKGEVFGFLGPNGAGKSTTIRHLMGFSRPQSGKTKVLSMESFENYHKILENVGYIPGEVSLPEGLTGKEFVEMMGRLRKTENNERLNYLYEKFKLDPNVETKRMSLGDKRKLAIITAFMNDPDVLILDEPTSGLDPVMQQNFVDFILDEKKRGKTILLSSHIFSEVDATCDRIAIIKEGVIVSTFESSDIKRNQNKVYQVEFENKTDFDQFVKLTKYTGRIAGEIKEISIVDFDSERLTAQVGVHDSQINQLIDLLSEYKLSSFSQIPFTLEDYFMKFYKEDKDFGGAL